MWQLVRNIQPTIERLNSKGCNIQNLRYLYERHGEDVMHLFSNYPFSLNAIPCLAGHSTDLGDEETRLHNIEAILKSYTIGTTGT